MHIMIHSRLSVAYPPDPIADQELWLAAAAQASWENILPHTASSEKIKIKIQNTVSTKCVSLLYHIKVQKA